MIYVFRCSAYPSSLIQERRLGCHQRVPRGFFSTTCGEWFSTTRERERSLHLTSHQTPQSTQTNFTAAHGCWLLMPAKHRRLSWVTESEASQLARWQATNPLRLGNLTDKEDEYKLPKKRDWSVPHPLASATALFSATTLPRVCSMQFYYLYNIIIIYNNNYYAFIANKTVFLFIYKSNCVHSLTIAFERVLIIIFSQSLSNQITWSLEK